MICILVLFAQIGHSQPSLISRKEALGSLFPNGNISSEQIFLTLEQVEQIEKISREKVKARLYLRFIITRDGQVIGRSYVDTHTVRSKRESLLISLTGDGRVLRVDVTAFLEPPEYIPSRRWLRQYEGKMVGAETKLNRGIQPILGATLTSRAVNSAVRRIHAMDIVLQRASIVP